MPYALCYFLINIDTGMLNLDDLKVYGEPTPEAFPCFSRPLAEERLRVKTLQIFDINTMFPERSDPFIQKGRDIDGMGRLR